MSTVRLHAPKTQNLETTSAEFVWECSVLSAHIYDSSVPLPPNWISLIPYYGYIDDGDYRGGCFVKYGLDKPNGIVMFASRGTANFQNLIDDWKVWRGVVLGHVENVYNKQMKILMDMQIFDEATHEIKNPSLAICQTGHSLGGVFADILNCMANINANGKSITFENPGSWDSLVPMLTSLGATPEDLAIYRTWCFAYQADVNAINTCRPQTGKTFRVMGIPYDYDPGFLSMPIPWLLDQIDPISNSYYQKYTLQQHSIVPLSQTLKDGKVLQCNRPFGLQAGYNSFINYEERKDYWDGYLLYFWDHNIKEIQKSFSSYKDFYLYSVTMMEKFNKQQTNVDKKLLATNSRLFQTQDDNNNSDINKNRKHVLCIEDFEILHPDEFIPKEKPTYKEMFLSTLGFKRS